MGGRSLAGVKRLIRLRQMPEQLVALLEPVRVPAVLLDYREAVISTTFRATVVIWEAQQIVATVDAEWVLAGVDGLSPHFQQQNERDGEQNDDDLCPQQPQREQVSAGKQGRQQEQ